MQALCPLVQGETIQGGSLMLKKPRAPLLSLFLVCNAAIAAEPEMATFAEAGVPEQDD